MDEKNIFIGTPPSKKEPINTVCPPFLINAEIKDIYTIGNKEYKNIVLFKTTNKIHASVTYKINSLYEKISFDLINLKEITDKDAYFAVMTDYDTIIEKKLITLDTKTAFEVNLKNINYLKFFFISNYNDISFMIANIVTE